MDGILPIVLIYIVIFLLLPALKKKKNAQSNQAVPPKAPQNKAPQPRAVHKPAPPLTFDPIVPQEPVQPMYGSLGDIEDEGESAEEHAKHLHDADVAHLLEEQEKPAPRVRFSRGDMKRAVILKEILDKPVSLRDPEQRNFEDIC